MELSKFLEKATPLSLSSLPSEDRCAVAFEQFEAMLDHNNEAAEMINFLIDVMVGDAEQATLTWGQLNTLLRMGINVYGHSVSFYAEPYYSEDGVDYSTLRLGVDGSGDWYKDHAYLDGMGTIIERHEDVSYVSLDPYAILAYNNNLERVYKFDLYDMLEEVTDAMVLNQACCDVAAAGLNASSDYSGIVSRWAHVANEGVRSIMASLSVQGASHSPEAALASIAQTYQSLSTGVNPDTGIWDATFFDDAEQLSFWKGAWKGVVDLATTAADIAIVMGNVAGKIIGALTKLGMWWFKTAYRAATEYPGPTISECPGTFYGVMCDAPADKDIAPDVNDESKDFAIWTFPFATVAYVRSADGSKARWRVAFKAHPNSSIDAFRQGGPRFNLDRFSLLEDNVYNNASVADYLDQNTLDNLRYYNGYPGSGDYDWGYDGTSQASIYEDKARFNLFYYMSIFDFLNCFKLGTMAIMYGADTKISNATDIFETHIENFFTVPAIKHVLEGGTEITHSLPYMLDDSALMSSLGLFDESNAERLQTDPLLITLVNQVEDLLFIRKKWPFSTSNNKTHSDYHIREILDKMVELGFGSKHYQLTSGWQPKYIPPQVSYKSFIVGCYLTGLTVTTAAAITFITYRAIRNKTTLLLNKRRSRLLDAQDAFRATPSEATKAALIRAENRYNRAASKSNPVTTILDVFTDATESKGISTMIPDGQIRLIVDPIKKLITG